MEEIVSFNNFIFDCNSGELRHNSNKKKVNRLQPQSAKLLQLLIKRHPDLVSKEEIKSLLWPNVQVNFDNSLHFCIRQIRVALEDDVSNPKYIETIPRRGYRWLAKVDEKKKKKPLVLLILAISILSILSISVNYFISKNNQENGELLAQERTTTRLVIMPIQPTDSSNLFYDNTIAYDLLALFSQTNKFEIIGPTTTQNVSHENIYQYMDESGADFVINGKFSGVNDESSLLVEIIRTSDKTHVWVTSFDTGFSSEQIISSIYNGFEESIAAPLD